jgi:archaetidylinositol phosphate synthase
LNTLKKSNTSFLAAREKLLLLSIADRLPLWVDCDRLTLFGVAGSVAVFLGYWATNIAPGFLALASLGLIMNWLGDSLDGTLARVRRCERPRYGFFVDHTSDLISQVLVGSGLALSIYVKMPYALVLLCAYLSFVGYTFIRACVFDEVRIAYSSIGPTETRLALIAANAALYLFPTLSQPLAGYSTSAADLICAMLAIFSFSVLLWNAYADWKILAAELNENPAHVRVRQPSSNSKAPGPEILMQGKVSELGL